MTIGPLVNSLEQKAHMVSSKSLQGELKAYKVSLWNWTQAGVHGSVCLY